MFPPENTPIPNLLDMMKKVNVLKKLELKYFKASQPEGNSYLGTELSWSVAFDNNPMNEDIEFELNGMQVLATGKHLVIPTVTTTYTLSARLDSAHLNLGEPITVTVNQAQFEFFGVTRLSERIKDYMNGQVSPLDTLKIRKPTTVTLSEDEAYLQMHLLQQIGDRWYRMETQARFNFEVAGRIFRPQFTLNSARVFLPLQVENPPVNLDDIEHEAEEMIEQSLNQLALGFSRVVPPGRRPVSCRIVPASDVLAIGHAPDYQRVVTSSTTKEKAAVGAHN